MMMMIQMVMMMMLVVGHFGNVCPPVLQLADPDCYIHTDPYSYNICSDVQMMMKIRLMMICSNDMIMIRFAVDFGDDDDPD